MKIVKCAGDLVVGGVGKVEVFIFSFAVWNRVEFPCRITKLSMSEFRPRATITLQPGVAVDWRELEDELESVMNPLLQQEIYLHQVLPIRCEVRFLESQIVGNELIGVSRIG